MGLLYTIHSWWEMRVNNEQLILVLIAQTNNNFNSNFNNIFDNNFNTDVQGSSPNMNNFQQMYLNLILILKSFKRAFEIKIN